MSVKESKLKNAIVRNSSRWHIAVGVFGAVISALMSFYIYNNELDIVKLNSEATLNESGSAIHKEYNRRTLALLNIAQYTKEMSNHIGHHIGYIAQQTFIDNPWLLNIRILDKNKKEILRVQNEHWPVVRKDGNYYDIEALNILDESNKQIHLGPITKTEGNRVSLQYNIFAGDYYVMGYEYLSEFAQSILKPYIAKGYYLEIKDENNQRICCEPTAPVSLKNKSISKNVPRMPWNITITPNPDEINTIGSMIWVMVFIAGLIATYFLVTIVRYIEKDNKNSKILAQEILTRTNAESEIKKLSIAVEHSPTSVIITDLEGNIEYINPFFEEMTGYKEFDVLGKNINILRSPYTKDDTFARMWNTIKSGKTWEGELMNKKSDGESHWNFLRISPIFDEDNTIINYLGILDNIDDKVKMVHRLNKMAFQDQLTGLSNRVDFENKFKQLKMKVRDKEKIAILFLDLDEFKSVNDSLGHDAGDMIIRDAAARIKSCVRESDVISRFGGDEFNVMLPIQDINGTNHVVEKILESLAMPFLVFDKKIHLSASIGITFYPDDGKELTELMKNGDIAMYKSKQDGKNKATFFTQSLNQHTIEKLEIKTDLIKAVERKEFIIHYQPKVHASSGEIAGFEALLRWQHPEKGMIPPFKFIDLLEETGLIKQAGLQIIDTVCKDIKRWEKDGIAKPVSINLSIAQLKDEDFTFQFNQIVKENNLDIEKNCIEMEITESLFMENVDKIVNEINSLKSTGVSISIDDFGTGYSSLAYLKKLPIDILKIDRSLISNIEVDKEELEIATAIISLAKTLNLKIVAEGVETKDQQLIIAGGGCDYIQGFYFCKPLPFNEISEILKTGECLPLKKQENNV